MTLADQRFTSEQPSHICATSPTNHCSSTSHQPHRNSFLQDARLIASTLNDVASCRSGEEPDFLRGPDGVYKDGVPTGWISSPTTSQDHRTNLKISNQSIKHV